jgi:hypothetical protein
MMTRGLLALAALTAVLGTALPAQSRPVAIRNARILTLRGEPIERGTVVMHNGKILSIGRDVEAPAGAQVVDARGGTLLPGIVSAYSQAGLTRPQPMEADEQRGRRGPGRRQGPMPGPAPSASPTNQAATAIVLSLYPRQEIFGQLLQQGVTTLSLVPNGQGFPGQGAILDPAGKTLAELTLREKAFVQIAPQASATGKKLVRDAFAAARRQGEARRPTGSAAAAPTSAPASAPSSPPGEQPASQPAASQPSAPASQPQRDPHAEALAELLDGKARAFLAVDSAADLLHYLDAAADLRFPTTVVWTRLGSGQGRLDEVLDQLKSLKAAVLMPPSLTSPPSTQYRLNPARILRDAGIEVGFIVGDSRDEASALFFRLMELVRHGLAADDALRAVTIVPARVLGIDDRVGTLEPGKDADVLLFDRDPLDPSSKLVRVWHRGEGVAEDPR